MRHSFYAILLLIFGLTGAKAEDAAALARALAAASTGDWARATEAADESGPLAADIITWQRLREGAGHFGEYITFAERNTDWPGMALFDRMAERAILPTTPAPAILGWFAEREPRTGAGMLALLRALPEDEVRAHALNFWSEAAIPLDEAQETSFLASFDEALSKSAHDARLMNLLDRGEAEAAQRMLALVSSDAAKLGRLRIDLQRDLAETDPDSDLPARLRDDPGLALDQFRALVRDRKAENRGERIRALMLAQSKSAEDLRNPAAWAPMRADHARLALREGDADLAYRLAAQHFLPEGGALWADLTFLAGFAALKADNLTGAAEHFHQLEANSTGLLSQSRALYWQGRTLEAAGDVIEARKMFTRAAAHQASYYGQLAAEAVGLPVSDEFLHQSPLRNSNAATLPDWRGQAILDDRRMQAAIWLHLAGAPDQGARFLFHMAETASTADIGRMARVMAELDNIPAALRIAKIGSAHGAVQPAALFPLPVLDYPGFAVPEELILAIARQESEFNPVVASHVGARGLMQLMPATAQDIARETGMAYDLAALSREADLNARFGAYYLRRLRDRFGPSVALVAAGYNAGPGRAAQWVDLLGDIRGEVDPVDWVEMIPYDETRNYVMRVAEGLAIYRARLSGAPVPFTLHDDLSGGGVLPPPPGPRQTIPFTLTDAPPPAWKGLAPGLLPDPVIGPR